VVEVAKAKVVKADKAEEAAAIVEVSSITDRARTYTDEEWRNLSPKIHQQI
jgi:hypothetical protein